MSKSYFKTIVTAAIILSISACASTNYRVEAINGSESKISLKDANFYLVNGGDGRMMSYTSLGDSDELAEGSGFAALMIANDTLYNSTSQVVAEKEVMSEDKALEVGFINKSDYLIYSRVEQWSDPLGINCNDYYYDEASVVVSLYSIPSKELISTSRLSAKSCPSKLNGIPLSSGSPEQLYTKLFSKWLEKNIEKSVKE